MSQIDIAIDGSKHLNYKSSQVSLKSKLALWYLKNYPITENWSSNHLKYYAELLNFELEFRKITKEDFNNVVADYKKNVIKEYHEYLSVSVPYENKKIKIIIDEKKCKHNEDIILSVLLFEIYRIIIDGNEIRNKYHSKSCSIKNLTSKSKKDSIFVASLIDSIHGTFFISNILNNSKKDIQIYKEEKKQYKKEFNDFKNKTLHKIYDKFADNFWFNPIFISLAIYIFSYSLIGIYTNNIYGNWNYVFCLISIILFLDIFKFKKFFRLFYNK